MMKPAVIVRTLAAGLAAAALMSAAHADTPVQLLAAYGAQAGTPPAAERGRLFFSSTHGREWSCASCHGVVPTQTGKHAATGKAIGPLAPAFNAERFTDGAKVEKWFRRNCNDVVGRACSPAEKADIIAWLISIKPQ